MEGGTVAVERAVVRAVAVRAVAARVAVARVAAVKGAAAKAGAAKKAGPPVDSTVATAATVAEERRTRWRRRGGRHGLPKGLASRGHRRRRARR